MRKTAVLLTLALFVVTPAIAEDINPPNWRGGPLTTFAGYEFLQPGVDTGQGTEFVYPTPDFGFLPLGDPILTHIPGPGAGWSPTQPTGDDFDNEGWVNLSGEIIIEIPNFENNNPRKQIWIQLTWEPQFDGSIPTVQIIDPILGLPSTLPLVRQELLAPGFDPVNPWRAVYHDTWHLELFPNPAFETILISGGINVAELVIDTQCVPEPATMSLLALGGLAILRRRKRG